MEESIVDLDEKETKKKLYSSDKLYRLYDITEKLIEEFEPKKYRSNNRKMLNIIEDYIDSL